MDNNDINIPRVIQMRFLKRGVYFRFKPGAIIYFSKESGGSIIQNTINWANEPRIKGFEDVDVYVYPQDQKNF